MKEKASKSDDQVLIQNIFQEMWSNPASNQALAVQYANIYINQIIVSTTDSLLTGDTVESDS